MYELRKRPTGYGKYGIHSDTMSVLDGIWDTFTTDLPENTVSLGKYIALMTLGLVVMLSGVMMKSSMGKVNFFGVVMNSIMPTNPLQLAITAIGGFMMFEGAIMMRNKIAELRSGG